MGVYDSAQTADLVGIIDTLSSNIDPKQVGL